MRHHVNRSRRRAFFFYLMPPPCASERRLRRSRTENLFLQARLSDNSGNKCEAVCALGRDAMIKATLAGPLRNTADEIHFTPADFPSFVIKFDDRTNWTSADDAPFAFSDVGNSYRLAVDKCCDRANSDCITDAIDVPAQWRFPVIDVFGRAEHFQIQARPALAPDVDRVALVEIYSPGGCF